MTTCPLCKGTGKRPSPSFADPSKIIMRSCPVCKEGNEAERVDLKADDMDDNGNSIIVIADDDTVESLADEIHETGGGAARKLAQMLAPANY